MADATQPNIDEFLGANERPRWQRQFCNDGALYVGRLPP